MTAPRKRWILSPIRSLMVASLKTRIRFDVSWLRVLSRLSRAPPTMHRRNLNTAHHTTWEKTLFSMVKPSVHNKMSRKRSFQKTLFKPEEFGIAAFPYSCGQKTLKKRKFSKGTRLCIHDISLPNFTNPNWPEIVAFFNGYLSLRNPEIWRLVKQAVWWFSLSPCCD